MTDKNDLLEQAFTRLAIMFTDKYCDTDNDITYHFDYDCEVNKHENSS